MDGLIAVSEEQRQLSITLIREDFNRLRGRLFQTVEAVGLPDHQSEAFKGLIRRTTYDMQASLEATLRKKGS